MLNDSELLTCFVLISFAQCRLSKYPWEADESFFSTALSERSRAFVQDLLMRNPDARKPIRTVVHSPVFGNFSFSHRTLSTTSTNITDLDLVTQ